MVVATPVADQQFNAAEGKNNGNDMPMNMLRDTQAHQRGAASRKPYQPPNE